MTKGGGAVFRRGSLSRDNTVKTSYAKINTALLLYLSHMFILLLGHVHFFLHFFVSFMENLFKKHPIQVLPHCGPLRGPHRGSHRHRGPHRGPHCWSYCWPHCGPHPVLNLSLLISSPFLHPLVVFPMSRQPL